MNQNYRKKPHSVTRRQRKKAAARKGAKPPPGPRWKASILIERAGQIGYLTMARARAISGYRWRTESYSRHPLPMPGCGAREVARRLRRIERDARNQARRRRPLYATTGAM
jgi:hypothetical protein